LNKAIRILINSILGLAVLLLFGVLVLPSLTGLKLEPVLSGSMEPTIHTGALIAITKTDTEQIQAGDIIGFHVPGMDTPVCHRVTEVISTESGIAFRTKGDANENADDWLVSSQDVIGKVYFNVSGLGTVAKFVKTPVGFILLMGVPALIVIVMELKNLFRPGPKKRKRPNLRQKPSHLPVIIAVISGLSVIAIPWIIMAGSTTTRTLEEIAGQNNNEALFTAQRNMQNKGVIPLVLCFTSDDETVVFSESHFRLLPGESKEISIEGTNGQAIIRTAGFFPLLPQNALYGLFVWNPKLALLITPAVWVIPLTAAGYFLFHRISPGLKTQRAKYFKGMLNNA
jgi:signal peptidase